MSAYYVDTGAETDPAADRAARRAGGAGNVGAPAALVSEMPAALDAALVRHGYKTKLGAPSLSTLMHRISVMSKAHQLLRQDALGASDRAGSGGANARAAPPPNPCADPTVRELLSRTRRAYAQRGERPRRQAALTKEPLQRLLATCDASVRGVRDRALLLFAFASGGRRRSEIVTARLEDLHSVDGGAFVFTLGHSKTNQSGQAQEDDAKPVAGSAAEALRAWLAVLASQGVHEGALFRRVLRGGHVGVPLTGQTVRNIVRERCQLAGIEGAFSAHSLRSGFVTEAARQAAPLADTMAMTGHRSVASVLGYFRAENVVKSPVARLIDR